MDVPACQRNYTMFSTPYVPRTYHVHGVSMQPAQKMHRGRVFHGSISFRPWLEELPAILFPCVCECVCACPDPNLGNHTQNTLYLTGSSLGDHPERSTESIPGRSVITVALTWLRRVEDQGLTQLGSTAHITLQIPVHLRSTTPYRVCFAAIMLCPITSHVAHVNSICTSTTLRSSLKASDRRAAL